MSTVTITKKDEIIMKLAHYFITEKNYTPIIVNGTKDEIWLENLEGPYRIIRINSNYIHNKEQYNYDILKTKSVMKQIKKKTFSFSMNALNIFLNVNDDVKISDEKDIESLKINSAKDLEVKPSIKNNFPDFNLNKLSKMNGLDLIMNVSKDINDKTTKSNEKYENIFKKKPIIITYVLIAINILMYLLYALYGQNFYLALLKPFSLLNNQLLLPLQIIYEIILSMFLHANILHIGFNLYALFILGTQLETFVGKTKFTIVYFLSGIIGGLLGNLLEGYGVGASGAIFGIIGALLYFGYNYRLYLGESLVKQLLPVVAINLFISLAIPNISFFAHFGGLVGGILFAMAVGVNDKAKKSELINGWICGISLIVFLLYLLITRL